MNSTFSSFAALPLAITVAIVCSAAPGCKGHGNSELLERELRCQENRIYHLEDELDDMCYALESSRRENQALKQERAGGDKGAGSDNGVGSRFGPSGTAPPSVSVPSGSPTITPHIEAPPLELSPPKNPRSMPKSNRGPELEEAPAFEPPRSSTSALEIIEDSGTILQPTSVQSDLTGDPQTITKLTFNRQLTGGWNADGMRGDEGVFVAVEPHDAENNLVNAAGDMSIVVLDPAQTGAAARVARWDFTTDEAEMHFRSGPFGHGMQFELPWPSNPPTNRDLRLFVRLTTPDGHKVEAETKIRVALCEKDPQGWSSKIVEQDIREEHLLQPESRLKNPKAMRRSWSPRR